MLFSLFSLIFVTPCSSFRWLKQPPPELSTIEAELSNIMNGQNILNELRHGSDCFRRAAGLIRVRCNEIDMDEPERVQAAISMTLCELATAKHYSPPLECAPFSLDNLYSYPQLKSSDSQGHCVDALSRSAQFWSSYSGYLRDIPQLCFSYRRWNDIDTARDIYRNISIDKISLLQLFIEREKAAEENVRLAAAQLQDMKDLLMFSVDNAHRIEIMSENIFTSMIQHSDQTLTMLQESIIDLHTRAGNDFRQTIEEITTGLLLATEQHGAALTRMLNNLQAEFVEDQSSSLLQLRTQSLDIFDEYRQMMYYLSIDTTTMLNESKTQIKALQDVQTTATISTARLVETIDRLTLTTQEEMAKINASTTAFIEALSVESWWNETLGFVLRFFFRLDASKFPSFHMLSFATMALYKIAQYILSGFVTVFLAARYIRKVLSRTLLKANTNVTLSAPSHQTIAPSDQFLVDPRLSRRTRTRRTSRISVYAL